MQDLSADDFDLSLTGFDPREIDELLALPDEERANAAPPLPENPVSRVGNLWLCGDSRNPHRLLCGDATRPESVARLLGDRKPALLRLSKSCTLPSRTRSARSDWNLKLSSAVSARLDEVPCCRDLNRAREVGREYRIQCSVESPYPYSMPYHEAACHFIDGFAYFLGLSGNKVLEGWSSGVGGIAGP